MFTVAYQYGICSCNVIDNTFGRSLRTCGTSFCSLFSPCYVIVIAFCYLSIYCRKNIQVGNLNEALLKREKRLANTVAWILLILVLTYFPGLLFGGVLVAKGVNNLPFRPFYVIFIQLNGVLNPLLNFSRIRKMRKAIRDLFRSHQQLQSSSLTNNNITRATTIAPPITTNPMQHQPQQ